MASNVLNLAPQLFKKRVELNKFTGRFISDHPYQSTVQNWKLSNRMIHEIGVTNETPTVKWIDNLEMFKSAVNIISDKVAIAVHCKSTARYSYLGIVSVLVISTVDVDYVIDCFALHSDIYELLSPVFRNPKILKIVFQGNFLPALQRDFNLFSVGVICVEELYCIYEQTDCVSKLSRIVSVLFGKELECVQSDEWYQRPLDWKLLLQVGKESFYILKTWHYLRLELIETVSSIPFSKSQEACLQIYEFPEVKPVLSSLPSSLQHLLKLPEKMLLFESLFKWRDEVARDVDIISPLIVSDAILGVICRVVPKSIDSINVIIPSSSHLSHEAISKLLEILERESSRIPESIRSSTTSQPIHTGKPVWYAPTFNVSNSERRRNRRKNQKLRNQLNQIQGIPKQSFKRHRGPSDLIRRQERKKAYLLAKYS